MDNALYSKGNSLVKSSAKAVGGKGTSRGGSGATEERAEAGAGELDTDAAEEVNTDFWYIYVAQAICQAAQKLQVELLSPKTLGYFIEWCDTPMARAPAVAYLDCATKYQRDGTITFCRKRSPDYNVYVGVDANLLAGIDPVLEAAVQRCQKIDEQTFGPYRKPTSFARPASP